jgi:type I restriction enzyme S subunit
MISAEWVVIALSAPSVCAALAGLAHEVARKTLNLEDVRSFGVPIPPRNEQERIVAEVDRQFSLIDTMDRAAVAAALRCDGLRRAILTTAFEGRLVRQDPNDEPASALLERIADAPTPATRRHRRSA